MPRVPCYPDNPCSLNKAEKLARKRKGAQAAPHIMNAMKDPNNLDAMISAALLCDADSCMEILAAAEARGQVILRRALGPNAFDEDGDCVGHFWGILETRPYMRVLQAQVQFGFQLGRYKLAWCVPIPSITSCSHHFPVTHPSACCASVPVTTWGSAVGLGRSSFTMDATPTPSPLLNSGSRRTATLPRMEAPTSPRRTSVFHPVVAHGP